MKKLHTITVQPNDLLFNWTLRVQLTNFRKHGFLNNYRAIIWIPHDRIDKGISQEWKQLEADFPEAQFFYYFDYENYLKAVQAFGYIPLLRPHCLRKHFAEHPYLKDDAIFYIDADVILSKPLDLTPFLSDDICYMSQAGSYINADYFDSKLKDVVPEKIYTYKEIDVLNKAAQQLGISREICVKNNENSGAAQYLLKGIDSKYWADVCDGCMILNVFLASINQRFFPSENAGLQRWCADIWAVLWNLWKRGIETKCPKELDFTWATDPIEKWGQTAIYHDAGATKGTALFNKRSHEYVNNISTPFYESQQGYLDSVDKNFCSSKYVEAIREANPNNNKI